jgi:hypothetical protein
MATGSLSHDNPPTGDNSQSANHKTLGLLWLDWENEGVETPLEQAIACFKAKFNRPPTLIYLSEKTVAQEYTIGKLSVVPARNCPSRHAMLF